MNVATEEENKQLGDGIKSTTNQITKLVNEFMKAHGIRHVCMEFHMDVNSEAQMLFLVQDPKDRRPVIEGAENVMIEEPEVVEQPEIVVQTAPKKTYH